ncbi:MAG: UDP-N-acetylmuramate dehydrogenase [Bacteroidetes bacterium]|nr:UDP-N-acetylmuramate dehydrogenase [Bacteroidota bacterium]
MSIADELAAQISGSVRENVPLAPFTTFRIGGNAQLFVEPATPEDVVHTRAFAATHSLPFFILGNGSNVLISDEGIAGVVMNLETGFSKLSIEGNIITAGAGVRMATFVDFAIRNNLAGVEMLAGIPATIGGAVWMNAGCYGGETSDHLLDVTIVRADQTLTLTKEECHFRYRHSGFEPGDIVVQARFALQAGNAAELREIKLKHLMHRNDVQPVNLPNCGSVFKNPKPHFSAQLIEEAGLKGTQIGGAQISPKHANFITNLGGATAQDVIAIMNLERKTVFERTGIVLEPEVQLIGFLSNPIEPLL